MPQNYIEHTRLLTENLAANPFWEHLTLSMDQVINPCIQGAVENLQNIRDPDVESYYAFLNIRMLGFKIPSLSFTPDQYKTLMRNLGKYYLTCGSSTSFIKFLSYVKDVDLIYQDLWANSLDMPINNLTQTHGLELWNGGDWFPTSYYDLAYSLIEFPDVDETQFRIFIKQLSPKHLVLRNIIGINSTSAQIYLSAIPLDRSRDISVAT